MKNLTNQFQTTPDGEVIETHQNVTSSNFTNAQGEDVSQSSVVQVVTSLNEDNEPVVVINNQTTVAVQDGENSSLQNVVVANVTNVIVVDDTTNITTITTYNTTVQQVQSADGEEQAVIAAVNTTTVVTSRGNSYDPLSGVDTNELPLSPGRHRTDLIRYPDRRQLQQRGRE